LSKYTVELRYIIDNEKLFPPKSDSLSLTTVLENYPLENESFVDPTRKDKKTRRQVLNENILSHFYFREIGFETVPMFLFYLKNKLNELMPLYNQKYKSIDMDINPIDNVNMTETFSHTIEGNGTSTSNGKSSNSGSNTNSIESLNVESDTPPSQLSETDIKNNAYASRTEHNKNSNIETLGTEQNTEGSVISKDNRTETYTRKEFGSSKGYTFAQNIQQWRDIMLNIDLEIVEELNSLFMNLY
jgi:hypothetical protein